MTPDGRLVRMHFSQALLEVATAYADAVIASDADQTMRLERELGALTGPLHALVDTDAPLRFADLVEGTTGDNTGRRAVVIGDEHLRHDDERGREHIGDGPDARSVVGLMFEGASTPVWLLVRSTYDGRVFWRRVRPHPTSAGTPTAGSVPLTGNGETPGFARGDGSRGDGRPSTSVDVRHPKVFGDRDEQEAACVSLVRKLLDELHDDGIADSTLDEAGRVLESTPRLVRHEGRVAWPIPARVLDELVRRARCDGDGVSAAAVHAAEAMLRRWSPAPSDAAAAVPPAAQAPQPSPASERGSVLVCGPHLHLRVGVDIPMPSVAVGADTVTVSAHRTTGALARSPGNCADCATREQFCKPSGLCWPGCEDEPIRVRVGRWARGEQIVGDSVEGVVVGDHGGDVLDVRSDSTGTLYEAIPSYAEVLRSVEGARVFTGWAWTRIGESSSPAGAA
jgi:hypothetical protein